MAENLTRETGLEQLKIQSKTDEKISSWISRGQSVIFPERYSAWEKWIQSNERYVEMVLKYLEALDGTDSMNRIAYQFIEDLINNKVTYELREVILHFSKKGPEFYQATAIRTTIASEEIELVEKTRQENEEFSRLYGVDTPKQM